MPAIGGSADTNNRAFGHAAFYDGLFLFINHDLLITRILGAIASRLFSTLAMADIRTLLRSELATRKNPAQTGSTGNRVTKKRKVDNGEDLTRKKLRPDGRTAQQEASDAIQSPSARAIDGDEVDEEETAGPDLPEESTGDGEAGQVTQETDEHAPTQEPQSVDEDEWAAFEREVVAPSRVPQAPAALAAPATISAAPMSAEQIAEQQGREKQAMRTREAQTEGEREDAARFLEDEFDEMEQLEERVRRLKQKREELRAKHASEEIESRPGDEVPPPESDGQGVNAPGAKDDNDDDEDDDDDEWDDWRFR